MDLLPAVMLQQQIQPWISQADEAALETPVVLPEGSVLREAPGGSTAVASRALWKQLFPPRNSAGLNLSFKAAAPFLSCRASPVHSFSFLLVNSTTFPNTSESLCCSLLFSLQNPPGLCLSPSQQPLLHSACYH